MNHVNSIEIHIFYMPAKCCPPHAKIQIGRIHSLNDRVQIIINYVEDSVKLRKIPNIEIWIGETSGYITAVYWRIPEFNTENLKNAIELRFWVEGRTHCLYRILDSKKTSHF